VTHHCCSTLTPRTLLIFCCCLFVSLCSVVCVVRLCCCSGVRRGCDSLRWRLMSVLLLLLAVVVCCGRQEFASLDVDECEMSSAATFSFATAAQTAQRILPQLQRDVRRGSAIVNDRSLPANSTLSHLRYHPTVSAVAASRSMAAVPTSDPIDSAVRTSWSSEMSRD